MSEPNKPGMKAAYGRVAEKYAQQFSDELAKKPLDRALLECFAELVRGQGQVADLGCGPAQIARYLHDRGISMVGIDLSPEMVEIARKLNPGFQCRTGDMTALDVPDGAWAGITAFYAIVHHEPGDLLATFRELFRVLAPGGRLLLSFHAGNERIRFEEWWGEKVDIEWVFLDPDVVANVLAGAGFAIEARIERAPYPVVEHPSTRAYILARKP